MAPEISKIQYQIFLKYFFSPTCLFDYFEEGSESVSEISGNIKGRVCPSILNFESMLSSAADNATVH